MRDLIRGLILRRCFFSAVSKDELFISWFETRARSALLTMRVGVWSDYCDAECR
jgi:hypothetical protein